MLTREGGVIHPLNILIKGENNMLQKNLFRKPDFHNIMWDGFQHGVICGANIKEIKEKRKIKVIRDDNPLLPRLSLTKKTWGLFLHVRMDNGDQIDVIMKLYRTKEYAQSRNDPRLNKPCKFRIPVLPILFNKLGIDEWVELVGTNVYIDTKDYKCNKVAMVMLRDYGDMKNTSMRARTIHPDFYEIHKGFFK